MSLTTTIEIPYSEKTWTGYIRAMELEVVVADPHTGLIFIPTQVEVIYEDMDITTFGQAYTYVKVATALRINGRVPTR